MANIGSKQSQAGNDVKSATERQLVFTSKYPTFKVAKTGTPSCSVTVVTSGVPAFGSYQTIAHGLNYPPNFLCFAELKSGNWFMVNDVQGYTESDSLSFDAYCDATNIYIRLTYWGNQPLAAGDYSRTIRYFVFADEAEVSGSASTEAAVKSIGWKASKPGEDVKGVDGRDLDFSTRYSALKMNANTTTSKSFGAAGEEITIAHGLSFVPGFLVYALTEPDQSNTKTFSALLPRADTRTLAAWADSTNLHIKLFATSQALPKTWHFRYVIFNEQIN